MRAGIATASFREDHLSALTCAMLFLQDEEKEGGGGKEKEKKTLKKKEEGRTCQREPGISRHGTKEGKSEKGEKIAHLLRHCGARTR